MYPLLASPNSVYYIEVFHYIPLTKMPHETFPIKRTCCYVKKQETARGPFLSW